MWCALCKLVCFVIHSLVVSLRFVCLYAWAHTHTSNKHTCGIHTHTDNGTHIQMSGAGEIRERKKPNSTRCGKNSIFVCRQFFFSCATFRRPCCYIVEVKSSAFDAIAAVTFAWACPRLCPYMCMQNMQFGIVVLPHTHRTRPHVPTERNAYERMSMPTIHFFHFLWPFLIPFHFCWFDFDFGSVSGQSTLGDMKIKSNQTGTFSVSDNQIVIIIIIHWRSQWMTSEWKRLGSKLMIQNANGFLSEPANSFEVSIRRQQQKPSAIAQVGCTWFETIK